MKKKVFRWVKVLALLYGLIGIAFYYLQDTLLFHPVAVNREVAYQFDQPFTEVNLPYNKETNLNIVQFRVTAGWPKHVDTAHTDVVSGRNDSTGAGAKGVVLYFHGNKRNVTWYARHAADFTSRGYEVWMLDYPGFGKSTGPSSEKLLYAYALQVYKLARSRYQPSQIIIYGKSLGSGIAAQLASVRNCRRLILESPYYSLTALVRHYMPVYPVSAMLHYHFPTNEFLPAVTDPVTIFHGTDDGLIPFSQSERLKVFLKPGDRLVPIEGGSHNGIAAFPAFQRELDTVLNQ